MSVQELAELTQQAMIMANYYELAEAIVKQS